MSGASPSSLALLPAAPSAAESLDAIERLLALRLQQLRHEWRRGAPTVDPVLGDEDLPEQLASLVLSGGKRFRPLLTYWGWVAAGGVVRGCDPTPMVQVGAALELLHAFALAQDDVMDHSTTRRGRPAVHVAAAALHRASAGQDDPARFGQNVAVLLGDLGHAEADALVAGLAPAVRHLWWRTCVELVRGQTRDLSAAATGGGDDPGARAWEVARTKSGAYTVQRPLELGATVAEGGAGALETLSAYGRSLGEAFALRDELLGAWGDPSVTGKPVSDDLRAGKATVLLALAEQRMSDAERRAAARLRRAERPAGDPQVEEDVWTVRRAMVANGARDEVERLVRDRVSDALAALTGDGLDPDGVTGLREVAGRIAWRER